MLLSLWGAPTWRPEIGKNIWSSLLPEKRFVFPCECWKSPEGSFLRFGTALSRPSSWCHARWKLGDWNCSIFKRKYDIELRNCEKTYFKVTFSWMKVKILQASRFWILEFGDVTWKQRIEIYVGKNMNKSRWGYAQLMYWHPKILAFSD